MANVNCYIDVSRFVNLYPFCNGLKKTGLPFGKPFGADMGGYERSAGFKK
jgi:hypothetical protein